MRETLRAWLASRPARVAARAATVLGSVLAGSVFILLLLNAFPPGSNAATLIGTMSWALLGPWTAVAAAVAAVVLLFALLQRARPLRLVFGGVALISLVASSVITGSIARVADDAGGSIDLGAALALSGPSPEPDRTETYATTDDGRALEALIYEPTTGSGDAPVILYIHGGGFVAGSPLDVGSALRSYADAGYLGVSVEYSLASDAAATWDVAPQEVACGLTWAAANAAQWGGDASRLFVMGDSAGGNLAVNLAWSSASGDAVSACPELGEVPVPTGAIATYPVVNPGNAYAEGRPFFGSEASEFTEDYIGGTPEEHPDRMAAISAETYLSPDVPPTLIVAAQRDDFIPAPGIYNVVDDAQAIGAPVSVTRVPFAHHGFDILVSSLGGQVKESIVLTYLADL